MVVMVANGLERLARARDSSIGYRIAVAMFALPFLFSSLPMFSHSPRASSGRKKKFLNERTTIAPRN